MRCDTPVFFQKTTPGQYNGSTGDYGPDAVDEKKRYASVTDTGTETMKIVYGSVKQGSRTIRLQTPYSEPFDRIRIGNRLYGVDSERKLRRKHVFVVSEVQGGRNQV